MTIPTQLRSRLSTAGRALMVADIALFCISSLHLVAPHQIPGESYCNAAHFYQILGTVAAVPGLVLVLFAPDRTKYFLAVAALIETLGGWAILGRLAGPYC